MDIKILKDTFLTIERCNLWKRQDQTIHKIMVYPGLLKSGKVELQNTIDRGNLWKILGIHCKVDPHREEYLLGRTAPSARYEETIHDRTGQLVSENLQGKAHFENFIMGSEITELVNKVRDQVRIRQKRMSSIAENCTEHSIIWGMFLATTLNAATFMGKNFSTMQSVVKNHESLTLKQMFDVTAQIANNEEEITGLDKILYQKNSWTQLSLINDRSSIFKAQRSTYSQILCYVSAKFFNILNATKLGRTELQEYEPRKATEIMMLSTESRPNSSGTFSQDSQRCSSVTRSAIF